LEQHYPVKSRGNRRVRKKKTLKSVLVTPALVLLALANPLPTIKPAAILASRQTDLASALLAPKKPFVGAGTNTVKQG